MPYGTPAQAKCLVCKDEFDHYKKLSNHVKSVHQLTPDQYYIDNVLEGITPRCPVCEQIPRFASIREGFKKYCVDHAHVAESEGGRIGGALHVPWNKDKSSDIDNRIKKLEGPENGFYGHRHQPETLEAIATAKRLDWRVVCERIEEKHPEVVIISESSEYRTQNSGLRIRCSACLTQDEVTFFNLMRCWRCRTCHPVGSVQQIEILRYVSSFCKARSSVRGILGSLEIDVWVSESNVGIEYHGLYWHSSPSNKGGDKKSHATKAELAEKEGIKLLQFFSDEWNDKQEICKSMIRNALGKNETHLHARDCRVVQLKPAESRAFLEETHISGAVNAKYHVGLWHKKHGLVGVSTVRSPIQEKWGNVSELARMSFARGTTVRGGASKMLKHLREWSLENGYSGMLSYADMRFGTGKVYEQCGFTRVGTTKPSYWYTDGKQRFDRFKYRAQDGMTEAEYSKKNRVQPVWGCGNVVYVWKPI